MTNCHKHPSAKRYTRRACLMNLNNYGIERVLCYFHLYLFVALSLSCAQAVKTYALVQISCTILCCSCLCSTRFHSTDKLQQKIACVLNQYCMPIVMLCLPLYRLGPTSITTCTLHRIIASASRLWFDSTDDHCARDTNIFVVLYCNYCFLMFLVIRCSITRLNISRRHVINIEIISLIIT